MGITPFGFHEALQEYFIAKTIQNRGRDFWPSDSENGIMIGLGVGDEMKASTNSIGSLETSRMLDVDFPVLLTMRRNDADIGKMLHSIDVWKMNPNKGRKKSKHRTVSDNLWNTRVRSHQK